MIKTMMGMTPGPMVSTHLQIFFDDSIGCVSVLGTEVLVPIGVEFKFYIFAFVGFVRIGV